MTDTYIRDRHHLEVVPDGTVISWLRIPGDQTSEAVAFVRREVVTDQDGYGIENGGSHAVVWISPGGWDPMTIEQAGVTFPAHVIRWGDVSQTLIQASEAPALIETMESGGSYLRVSALDAAARVFQTSGRLMAMDGRTDDILAMADQFVDWLSKDPLAEVMNEGVKTWLELPDPEDPAVQAQADAVPIVRSQGLTVTDPLPDWWPHLPDAVRLRVLADETDWAAKAHQVNRHVSTRAIRDYADKLERGE